MISLFGSKRKNNPERSLPRRGNKNQLEKSLAVTEAKLMMQEKLMKPGEIGPWLVGSSTNSLGIIYRNFSSYAFNILSIYIYAPDTFQVSLCQCQSWVGKGGWSERGGDRRKSKKLVKMQ